MQLYNGGAISYPIGGWASPYGIEYKVDRLSAIFLLMVCIIALFSIIYAMPVVEKEISKKQQNFFYSIYLLCFAGLLGVCSTNDIFNLYIFFEVSSLATYALVAMGKDRRALVAAFEYLVLGAIGASFFLMAIGLIYSATGSLNISDIALQIKPALATLPIKMALAFLTVGLALKIGIFPLHLWLTNSYTNAPSFVSAFLGGTTANIGIYVIIRITYGVFGRDFSYELLPLGHILIFLGSAGFIVASVVAILQDNVKRMLAYSSVAQIGYIIIGIGLANIQGISGALMQVVFHAATKTAMFMTAGAVMFMKGGVRIENFAGIGRRMPFTMSVFIISGLSLVGIPGTAGFIAKWNLLQAAISAGMWSVFAMIIISSLLTMIYVWRIVEIAFFQNIDANKDGINEAPFLMLVPMLALSLLVIIIGLWPAYVTGYISQAATALFGR